MRLSCFKAASLLLGLITLSGALSTSETSELPGSKILRYLHSRGEALDITAPQPLKVIYIDWRDVNWNAPQQNVIDIVNGGYNVVILAFYLTSGPTDMLQTWTGVNSTTINATMAYAHSKGAVVLATAGGSDISPYDVDAVTYATDVSQFVQKYQLDGIDYDLENLDTSCMYNGMDSKTLVQWMVTATTTARKLLGPLAIITHAPQAPYFGAVGGSGWAGSTGCYTSVWAQAGNAISWFNLQFYNQGPTCYTTYESLFIQSNANQSCKTFPGTSVSEIASYGIPLNAIVVGKPLETSDAGSGYVAPAQLHAFFTQAQAALNWTTGVMAWSWETTDGPTWIATVYPS